FLFYYRMWLPLSPTLFPYTTLFRSLLALRSDIIREAQSNTVGYQDRVVGASGRGEQVNSGRGRRCAGSHIENQIISRVAAFLQLDRKSTRLNSSHVSISYAVFCLKK